MTMIYGSILLIVTAMLSDTSEAYVYDPAYGNGPNLFSVSQYLLATSYVECIQSSVLFPPGYSPPCETGAEYTFASDPANKRAYLSTYDGPGKGYQQFITANGTYWIFPTWDNTTGTLSGPFGCFRNSAATYDAEVINYSRLQKTWDFGSDSVFTGLISHGGVCGIPRTGFTIAIDKRGYLHYMYVATPIPRGKGTVDQKLVGNYWIGFPEYTGATPPSNFWDLPNLCSGTVPELCDVYDY